MLLTYLMCKLNIILGTKGISELNAMWNYDLNRTLASQKW